MRASEVIFRLLALQSHGDCRADFVTGQPTWPREASTDSLRGVQVQALTQIAEQHGASSTAGEELVQSVLAGTPTDPLVQCALPSPARARASLCAL